MFKKILNTTGKNNFQTKILELKEYLGPSNTQNMMIFVYFIIMRIITSSSNTINTIFIDFIRQLNIKGTVENAIQLIVTYFLKCLAIDEEQLMKVMPRINASLSIVKIVVSNLAQFLGSLTLAHNRPILSKDIDLKKILIEGF